MFYSLRKRLQFAKFNAQIKGITDTPAIACTRDAGVVCVSHIGKMYLYAYLLAIKSLAARIPLEKVIVVDDLSLDEDDKSLLRKHVRGIDIRAISDIANDKCPGGGDWEGFLLIGDEVERHFCVLLDADTVATGNLAEVAEAISRNLCFTLGTWKDQQIVPVPEAYEHVKSIASEHVQIVAEKALSKINNAANVRYVRGCGGFAGFAKGKAFRRDIEAFSSTMSTILGEPKWREWGSQQVASNYIIANMPGSIVLPFPRYASFGPGVDVDQSSFVHFIGSHRFVDGVYARTGRKVIQQLGAQEVNLTLSS